MKRFAATCLVLAPVALAISTGIDPALGEDQGYGIYRDHPEAIQWHSLLLHWAWLLFVPGLAGLLAPIRRRGWVLAAVTWVCVMIGLTTFSALMASDFVQLAEEQHLPNEEVARLGDAFEAMPILTLGWQLPGLVGWALALLLTPIAAARGRVISWWIAAAAEVGAVLYLVFAISPVPLNLSGPVVLIGAYTAAAWQLLRRPVAAAEENDRFGALRDGFGRASMIAAPLCFVAGMATVPDAEGGFTAHPTLAQVSALLLHLAWLLFVPALWTLAERGRRWTRLFAGLTIIGLINFSALMLGDYADLAVRQTIDGATADAIGQALGSYTTFGLGWVLPGMILTFAGLLATTIAASAERVVRWWVPTMVGIGLSAFFALGIGILGIAGPLLILAAFLLAQRQVRQHPVVAPAAPTVAA